MRVFADFDAVKAAVGEEVGVSDWVLVSQQRIDRFAEATGDDQWIHVDVERARREMPNGTTIAHGLLTLSLVPSFFRTVLRVEGVKNSLNYGSDRVRYLSPVPAGSRLRGRIGIAQAVDVPPNGLRVTYHITPRSRSKAASGPRAWPTPSGCISGDRSQRSVVGSQ
jgi:acyl dehydratase